MMGASVAGGGVILELVGTDDPSLDFSISI